jgi:predicted dithiol-disulfide oxidoreductase (DUF899 family)
LDTVARKLKQVMTVKCRSSVRSDLDRADLLPGLGVECVQLDLLDTRRGVEAMDNSYRLLDLTVYGRQERWEDSPPGWPQRPKGQHNYRTDRRPIVQWPRLKAGYSDDLATGGR